MVRRSLLALLVCGGCGRLDFSAAEREVPRLSYPANVHAVLNQTQLELVPTSRESSFRYAVQPDLPAGVELDPITGVIAGTPSEIVDRQIFTVSADNSAGRAVATVRLTVLPGSVVTSLVDREDDDGGVDATCLASDVAGCTLRAAIQTANHRDTPQLILLDAATYVLRDSIQEITADITIAGQDATTTVVRPAGFHPGYRMATLATPHTLRLEDATFQDFGVVDGAVVAVTAGTLDVYACAFANNEAASAGGVLFINDGAQATFESSTFSGNRALGRSGWGGVVDAEGAGTKVVVKKSTATQNSAVWGSFSHITTGSTLRLENSTLYDNLATRAGTLATPGGVYTLVNDTIAYNRNTFSDSAALYLFSTPGSFVITNTIVAFNTDQSGEQNNCNRNDLATEVKSGGGNLFGDDAGNCASYFNVPLDYLLTDPSLDPLGPADNGGITKTISLSPASFAIDRGQASGCPAEDQRGLPRPGGGGCDIGAVEMQ